MLKWIKETGRAIYGYAFFMVTGNTEKMFYDLPVRSNMKTPSNTKTQGNSKVATIQPTPDGKYAIVNRGQTLQVYSRKRDAARGAERRGLTLA